MLIAKTHLDTPPDLSLKSNQSRVRLEVRDANGKAICLTGVAEHFMAQTLAGLVENILLQDKS